MRALSLLYDVARKLNVFRWSSEMKFILLLHCCHWYFFVVIYDAFKYLAFICLFTIYTWQASMRMLHDASDQASKWIEITCKERRKKQIIIMHYIFSPVLCERVNQVYNAATDKWRVVRGDWWCRCNSSSGSEERTRISPGKKKNISSSSSKSRSKLILCLLLIKVSKCKRLKWVKCILYHQGRRSKEDTRVSSNSG